MKKTVPLFTNNTKLGLGVLCVVLVFGALVVVEFARPVAVGEVVRYPYVVPEPSNSFVVQDVAVGELLGSTFPALTRAHLLALRPYKIQTNAGRSEVVQSLVLSQPGVFRGGELFFGRNNEGRTGHFLKFGSDDGIFEYVLSFSPGWSSVVSDGLLSDLRESQLTLMGRTYAVLEAAVDAVAKRVSLKLMGEAGAVRLVDGYADDVFSDGAEVRGKRVDAKVRVKGVLNGNVFTIYEIRYRPLGSGPLGDVFVPPNNGLRSRLRDPGVLLSSSFDIIYGGFKGGSSLGGGGTVSFSGHGKEYRLNFVNSIGQAYSIPLVTTEPNFKYGDDDEDLVFKEGGNGADFNIDRNDIFVVTNKEDVSGATNVLRYNRVLFDRNEIVIDDLAGGSQTVIFDEATGEGVFTASGKVYRFVVSLMSPHPIVVDQNGDGSFDGDEARIVLFQGSQLDLGSANTIAGSQIELSVITPRRLFAEPENDEMISFVINEESEGPDLEFPNPGPLTVKSESGGVQRGLSVFGVYMVREGSRVPADVVFVFPGAGSMLGRSQAEGRVMITFEREKYVRKK